MVCNANRDQLPVKVHAAKAFCERDRIRVGGAIPRAYDVSAKGMLHLIARDQVVAIQGSHAIQQTEILPERQLSCRMKVGNGIEA